MSDLSARPVPEDNLYALRMVLTEQFPDTIAVVVLSGSPETGLAMGVSSKLVETETLNLLAHAIVGE